MAWWTLWLWGCEMGVWEGKGGEERRGVKVAHREKEAMTAVVLRSRGAGEARE